MTPATNSPPTPCLYCRQTDRPFTSVEHVFPESLGNQDIILPKGTVCTKCNNGVLARIDQALVNFPAIRFLRTVQGVETKRHKLPSATFANLDIRHTAPSEIHMKFGDGGWFKKTEDYADGWSKFEFAFKGKPYGDNDFTNIARALCKMALGCIHLDHGATMSMSERYESARLFVMGKGKLNGFIAIAENMWVGTQGALTYVPHADENGYTRTGVLFTFHGVVLYTEMERRKPWPQAFLDIPGWAIRTFK